jgi:hypothetical protein
MRSLAASDVVMVARTSPRLAGAGSISGKAVAWGVVWSDLKAAGAVSADALIA